MPRGLYFNKQYLSSNDLAFDFGGFGTLLSNIIEALTVAVYKLDGEGSIYGSYDINSGGLEVSIVDTATLGIASGSVIDTNGEYFTVASDDTYENTSIVADGVYNFYVQHVDDGSSAAFDDKSNAYYTEYDDSYEFSLTASTLLKPWIKLAEVTITGGSIVSVSDFRYNSFIQVAATDYNVFVPSGSMGYSGSNSWQTTVYDHINALGEGTVTVTNPHGLNIVSRFLNYTDKPLYLVENATHGNGWSLYDPTGTTPFGSSSVSSHLQDYNGAISSGCVRVARWADFCGMSTRYPSDSYDPTIVFDDDAFSESDPLIYPVSSPPRQGGIVLWVDGEDIPRGETDRYTDWVLDDSGFDWRQRWLVIEGMWSWSYDIIGKTPEGMYKWGINAYLDYNNNDDTTIYYHPMPDISSAVTDDSDVSLDTPNGTMTFPVTKAVDIKGGNLVFSVGYTSGGGTGVGLLISNSTHAPLTVFIYADSTDGKLMCRTYNTRDLPYPIYVAYPSRRDYGTVFGNFALKIQASPKAILTSDSAVAAAEEVPIYVITLGDLYSVFSSYLPWQAYRYFRTQLQAYKTAYESTHKITSVPRLKTTTGNTTTYKYVDGLTYVSKDEAILIASQYFSTLSRFEKETMMKTYSNKFILGYESDLI